MRASLIFAGLSVGARRATVADAADSVHRGRAADETGVTGVPDRRPAGSPRDTNAGAAVRGGDLILSFALPKPGVL